MSTPVQKICVVCGKDVAGLKRVKDQSGRYYCAPCHQALLAKASQPAPPAPPAPPEPPDAPVDLADLDRELDLVPLPPSPPRTTPRASPSASPSTAPAARPAPTRAALTCPCCHNPLAPGVKICVACGIKVPSGRPLITALGRDESQFQESAEKIIRPIAWIIWFGLYPIASEAYGSKKPFATWTIAILTTLCSIAFFATMHSDGDHQQATQLMLWPSHHTISDAQVIAYYHRHYDDPFGQALRREAAEIDAPEDATEDDRILAAFRAAEPQGDFRWYQLFTNAALHDYTSIVGLAMHLGGNMLFFLIFGTRVNALIGNLKFALLYPILAAAASAAQLLFSSGTGPALGASGAIMGLAGMYLVFFPIHRVYMAFWIKISWLFPAWIVIWALRGFWVLAFYLSFDVVSTLLRSRDGVAHWAHLGGFIAGAALAAIMLIARLQDAHHADLFSVILGKFSWPLIGKPRRAPLPVPLVGF